MTQAADTVTKETRGREPEEGAFKFCHWPFSLVKGPIKTGAFLSLSYFFFLFYYFCCSLRVGFWGLFKFDRWF
jgi:hypothetical protein